MNGQALDHRPVIEGMLGALVVDAAHLAADEDLEELIITLSGHHRMVRPLSAPEEECLFPVVSFDRDQVDPALARHHLHALEAQVVAQITTQGVA